MTERRKIVKNLFILFTAFFLNTLYAEEYKQSIEPSQEYEDSEISEIDPRSDTKSENNGSKIINNVAFAKELVGVGERVRIYPGGIVLKAKIDTGAETSSLHVTSTELIFRNGKEWIRFTVTDLKGKTAHFEEKIHRISTVKRHHDKVQKRIVVLLGICLGTTYRETEVNLFDRGGLNYPLLIGRQFTSGFFIVDPAQVFSIKPDCKEVPEE